MLPIYACLIVNHNSVYAFVYLDSQTSIVECVLLHSTYMLCSMTVTSKLSSSYTMDKYPPSTYLSWILMFGFFFLPLDFAPFQSWAILLESTNPDVMCFFSSVVVFFCLIYQACCRERLCSFPYHFFRTLPRVHYLASKKYETPTPGHYTGTGSLKVL